MTSTGGIVLTNTSNASIDGFFGFVTEFSSFNAGGPPIGLSIDDPLTQAARFSSRVSGEGIGDSHSCSVGFLGYSGATFSPTTCGVVFPDSSLSAFSVMFTSFEPNQQLFLPYNIDINADFIFAGSSDDVPEPSSLLLLAAGALGLYMRRRAKNPRT